MRRTSPVDAAEPLPLLLLPLPIRIFGALTRIVITWLMMCICGVISRVVCSLSGAGGAAQTSLGMLAGFLLCLMPELCTLVVLRRIGGDPQGPIRFWDLWPRLRRSDEIDIPAWHPDAGAARNL